MADISERDAMSRFSTEVRVNADRAEVLRMGQSILEEMDLLFQDRDLSYLIFKEKYRFDPFNPVKMKLKVEGNGNNTIVRLEGENIGIGPYQETHVKRIVFQLMDRLEESLDTVEQRKSQDPDMVRELELLDSLHEKGILTDHEFQRAKQRILE
jgi:hypothetical protein